MQKGIYRTVFLLFLAILVFGCAKKETRPENIRSLAAIRTACSTKSASLIKKAKEQVQHDFEAGLISPDFEKELANVFVYAEKGDWDKSVKEVNRLQNKYKPSPSSPGEHEHNHGDH